MLRERINNNQKELEAIKRFFVNPEDPDSAKDLADLSANAVLAMAEIYATKGDLGKMTPQIKKWLTNPNTAESPLERQVGEVLRREAGTRLFDNHFMGQIHPQGSKIGIIANLIGAYMNTNRIYKGVSPAEAEMEADTIWWLSTIFGYDAHKSGGNITTGGTTANIEAMWVARQKMFQKLGMSERKATDPFYVLVSKYRHYSIDKAANMLGMRLVTVPDQHNFKIDINALKSRADAINKAGGHIAAIIGIAGETETGMVEDLNGVADIARKYGAFFHVDAAYGGPYVLSNAKGIFSGINRADSITIDPHKMLYTPYAAGSVIFRNEEDHLLISKVHETRYLRNVVARVEGSMGSAGVIATWATKELLGNDGIATILNNNIALTDFAYRLTQESSILRPVFKPELNTLLIGLKARPGLTIDRYNCAMEHVEKVMEDIRPGKTMYISRNEKIDDGRDALRFLSNHIYTTKQNIADLLHFVENEIKKKI